jgi:two-component system NtrC family sensor kinase
MAQMSFRHFLQNRSISFRLYLIIIPTTILAISLIGYVDGRVAARMLDSQVKDSSVRVATQLAEDLSRKGAPTNPDRIRAWLGELVESNFYILRIDVYHLSDDGLVRFVTTSTSQVQPFTADEMAAVQESKLMVVPQYQEQERFLKVISPIQNAGRTIGCVSVIATLKQSDLVGMVHDRIALFLVPVSVLTLVLMLHYLFTKVLTQRIGRLIHVITQVRSGNLAKRASIDRRDELGIIAERYNEMMEEIERATLERDRLLDELKDFNIQLQDKILEATLELSSANEQLRQVNQDLVETQRRLTQSERAAVAGQMAATFAHEIGSPLSAISTHLELLGEDSTTSEDSRRRLKLIQEQLSRITGFVEELLSETRLSAAARGPVQLNRLLQQLLLFLEQHLERNHVEVETHFSPDLPEIEANAQQLQQVFLNLLNNACDAMPGGGTIQVSTANIDDEGGNFVVVSVADNGIGIPLEKQNRIFEPFFTTKDLRRGTGLGLSIAAKIIRQHDGTIELASSPGNGTRFTVRFRVAVSSLELNQEAIAGR